MSASALNKLVRFALAFAVMVTLAVVGLSGTASTASAQGCVDDIYEPNDKVHEEATITLGEDLDGTLCGANSDFYRFTATEGDRIQVNVTHDGANGPVEARLFVQNLNSYTFDSEFLWTAEYTGRFRVKVKDANGDTGAAGTSYTVNVTILPPLGACVNDAYEPNDEWLTATPITPGEVLSLQLCEDDDEYFSFAASKGDLVTINLDWADDPDPRINLFGEGAASETLNDWNSGNPVHLIEESGNFILWIYDVHDDRSAYTLTVDIQSSSCVNDSFEANDSEESAAPLTIGVPISGQLCATEYDYFEFTGVPGDLVEVSLVFDEAAGELGMELFPPQGGSRSGVASADGKTITYRVNDAGQYSVLVGAAGPIENSYELTVTATTCVDDELEDNDTAATATVVQPNTPMNATICSGPAGPDPDWFRVSIEEGTGIEPFLSILSGSTFDARLDLSIYDQSGQLIGTTNYVDIGVIQISEIAPADGVYFVSVVGSKYFEYELTLENPRFCDGLRATVDLGAGDLPSSGSDVIVGTDGDDVIYASYGNDLICAGEGDDIVIGQSGRDRIFGEEGDDLIIGGDQEDTLSGGPGVDFLSGGRGADTLVGDAGNDLLMGGDGNDRLDMDSGSAGDDTLFGGDGNDVAFGGDGDDLLSLGNGDDFGWGGNGADIVMGGAGPDFLIGDGSPTGDLPTDPGADLLFGGSGVDVLVGGDGQDELFGGAGDDRLYGQGGDDTLSGGVDNDLVEAGSGNDAVYGGAGTDVLFGGPGDDELSAGRGDDFLFGEEGNDTIFGGPNADQLFGGSGDDYLSGGPGIDFLDGGFGGDSIFGGNGSDTLSGGPGVDSLYGGYGDDDLDSGADVDFLVNGQSGTDTCSSGTDGGPLFSCENSP